MQKWKYNNLSLIILQDGVTNLINFSKRLSKTKIRNKYERKLIVYSCIWYLYIYLYIHINILYIINYQNL